MINVSNLREKTEKAIQMQHKEQLVAVRNQIKISLDEMNHLAEKGRWEYSVILPISILAFEIDFLNCFEYAGFKVNSTVLGKTSWFFPKKERHEITISWCDVVVSEKNPLEIFYAKYEGVVNEDD